MFDKIVSEKDNFWALAEHDVIKLELLLKYSVEQMTELLRLRTKFKRDE